MSYITGPGGGRIAVSRLGSAPTSIVLVPGAITQVEVVGDDPLYARFMSRLADVAAVVAFDRRGTGLSDPTPGTTTLDDLVADIGAVVDTCVTPDVVLFGFSLGALAAIRFAALHGERVRGLIVFGGMARWMTDADRAFGLTSNEFEDMVRGLEEGWGTGASLRSSAPSLAHDSKFIRWGARVERHTCPPAGIRSVFEVAAHSDVRRDVASLDVPSLVMHRAGDMVVDVAHGRSLAQHLSDARYVELAGDDHLFWIGDQNRVLREVATFIGASGRRYGGADMAAMTTLSAVERDVAELAVVGLSNAEIAQRLVVSRHTVDSRLRRIYRKLGVRSRAQLASALVQG